MTTEEIDKQIRDAVLGEQKPADPANPADPADPANPANPADPADPADPANPADPADPADPANPADYESFTTEQRLEFFNKATGLEIASVDDFAAVAEAYKGMPGLQEKAGHVDALIEKLKGQSDVLSYFPDETAYKAAQLSKDVAYSGKEGVLNEVMRSDVAKMDDMDVLTLSAKLSSANGTSNPLGVKLSQLGLNVEDILTEGYERTPLENDIIKNAAHSERQKLSQIGGDVELPKAEGDDILEKLTQDKTASMEDIKAKRDTLTAPAEKFVSSVNKVEYDGFVFEFNAEDASKGNYKEGIIEDVMDGYYDLQTEQGQKDIQEDLLKTMIGDNYEKIFAALSSHIKTQTENEVRKEYDNAGVGLNKKEPIVGGKEKKTVEDRINEMFGKPAQ